MTANCFKPGVVWNDSNGCPISVHGGGIIYVDGIYYWYGEHKKRESNGGLHCYSSKDLYHGENRSLVLLIDYKHSSSDIVAGCILERPKVIYNDSTGKYMMYFKFYPKSNGGYEFGYLGVATADSPSGPFIYSHKFLGTNSPKGSGDFCIYKDEDGKVYHFTVRKPDKAFVVDELNKEDTYPKGTYSF